MATDIAGPLRALVAQRAVDLAAQDGVPPARIHVHAAADHVLGLLLQSRDGLMAAPATIAAAAVTFSAHAAAVREAEAEAVAAAKAAENAAAAAAGAGAAEIASWPAPAPAVISP